MDAYFVGPASQTAEDGERFKPVLSGPRDDGMRIVGWKDIDTGETLTGNPLSLTAYRSYRIQAVLGGGVDCRLWAVGLERGRRKGLPFLFDGASACFLDEG